MRKQKGIDSPPPIKKLEQLSGKVVQIKREGQSQIDERIREIREAKITNIHSRIETLRTSKALTNKDEIDGQIHELEQELKRLGAASAGFATGPAAEEVSPEIERNEQKQAPNEVFSPENQMYVEEIRNMLIERGDMPESARKEDVTVGTFYAPQYAKGNMQEEMEEIEKQAQFKELRDRLTALNREAGHAAYHTHDKIEEEVLAAENELRRLESSGQPVVPRPGGAGETQEHVPSVAKEMPVITELTRRELRIELENLIKEETEREQKEREERIERGKALRIYPEHRLGELDAEAEKMGIVEKGFRKLGEQYNKRGWKIKLAVGLSLGIGAGALLATGAYVPGVIALLGVGVQRSAGMASMFLKYEKKMLSEERDRNSSRWRFGSKEKAMWEAIKYTAVMTSGMLLLVEGVKEGVEYANQHQWGEQVREWLGHMLGHHAPAAPVHPAAATAAGEVVTPHAPEMPTVVASTGRGYEQMLYKMGQELHDKYPHGLPKDFGPKSDAAQLWDAVQQDGGAHTHEHLKNIVHVIAKDPQHDFFHEVDGTNVRIDPTAHLTISADGQLHLGDATHPDMVHAVDDMGATHPYHPEANVPHEATVLPHPPVEVPPAPPYAPPPPLPPAAIEQGAVPTPDSSVVHNSAGNPLLNDSGQPIHMGTHQPEHEAHAAPEAPHPPEVSGHFKVNALGCPVDVSHAIAYHDAQGNIIIFGGSLEDRAKEALKLVTKDHKAVVYFDSTRPAGPFGLFSIHHISKAYWFEGSGNTLTPVGPGGAIQVHEPVIVDDTIDPALRSWRLPSIDDLKDTLKSGDKKP
ncbi:MAG: hypothetical protein ACYC75_01460 [Minisyncoccota bacterium]